MFLLCWYRRNKKSQSSLDQSLTIHTLFDVYFNKIMKEINQGNYFNSLKRSLKRSLPRIDDYALYDTVTLA